MKHTCEDSIACMSGLKTKSNVLADNTRKHVVFERVVPNWLQ